MIPADPSSDKHQPAANLPGGRASIPGPGGLASRATGRSGDRRTGGRRGRRSAATRQALVEAGLDLVKLRGLFGIRIEDITERCDLAKGAFYNYFESKDALFAELLARGVEALERAVRSASAGLTGQSGRVRSVVRAHQRFFDERPEYALLFHQGRGLLQLSSGDGAGLQAIYRDYLTRLASWVLPSATGLTVSRRLDLAALLAGAVGGHRSYRLSAGLEPDGRAVEELLAAAWPSLVRSGRKGPRARRAAPRRRP